MAKSLKDFDNGKDQLDILKMSDIEGETVTVTGFVVRDGDYGPCAWMTLERATGDTVKVITGSDAIMQALKAAKDAKAFPVEAKFSKHGRAWGIDPVEDAPF